MANIGIMGGTFNPIHNGHLQLAKAAYKEFNLDYVLFLPSGQPPHKIGKYVALGHDRLNMVEIAISDIPYFKLSNIEIKRQGKTYTADTLCELHQIYPNDNLYFILGADSLFSIEEWYMPWQIISGCIILAAKRDGITDDVIISQINYLNNKYNGDIRLISENIPSISSSYVRNMLANGISDNECLHLVPEKVLEYIKSKNLYINK